MRSTPLCEPRSSRRPLRALLVACSAALCLLTSPIALAQTQASPPPSDIPPAEDLPHGQHCAGENQISWVIFQHLVAQLNPDGGEHHVRAGLCLPLITEPGPLFDLTSLEFGVLTYLTPAYFQGGGYVQLIPLSLLVLRAEISGVTYWPLGLNRTGYYGFDTPDVDFREDSLPAEDAEVGTGWNVNLIAVLRAKVPLGPVALVALSQFAAEYWDIGDAPFHFNMRRDAVTAKGGWVLTNEAAVLVEIPLPASVLLRVGAYDTYRYVIATGYEGNLAGLMVMAELPRVGDTVRNLQPFIRGGVHTTHDFRVGEFTMQAGVFMTLDLGW